MVETSLPFWTRFWFAWSCLFQVLFDGEFAARVWAVREPPRPALPPGRAKGTKGKLPPKPDKRRGKRAERADDDEDEPVVVAKKKLPPGKTKRSQVERRDGDGKAASRVEPAKRNKVGPGKEAKPTAGRPIEKPAPTAKPAAAPLDTTAALQLLALLQREGRLVDFLEQEIAAFSDAEIGAATRVVHEGCRRALHEHAKLEPVRTEDEDTTVTIPAAFKPAEIKLTGNVQGKPPYKGTLRHRGWRAREVRLPVPAPGHDASIIAPAEVEL